jgi:hypothetical protein
LYSRGLAGRAERQQKRAITTSQTYLVLRLSTAPIQFVNMPSKCSAVNCKSGYDSNKERHDGITFHRFPLKNKDLLNLWLRRISRVDFVPTQYSKLCSLHFKESDFLYNIVDTNKSRRKRYNQDRRKLRHLQPTAVPSIFENLPSYFSSHSQYQERLSERPTTSRRIDKQ